MTEKGAGVCELSLDPAELAHYESAADLWWDTTTVAGWLHEYNHVRVPYIRDALSARFARDVNAPSALQGLRLLDIGCGGGVLCEPLARLGAEVTGVDPVRAAIRVAARHADGSGLSIDYRCDTVEGLARAGGTFDAVLAMEVVEHVADLDAFLSAGAALIRPGGLLILSTINRTVKSYVYAIAIGEYIARLLPRGAHRWKRFVKPEEIAASLAPHRFKVVDVSGVTMNLRSRRLQLSPDKAVNYVLTAAREGSSAG